MNEEILRNLNYRLDEALDYTRQLVEDDNIGEQMDKYKLKVERFVAENPVKAVAGGLLAGYVFGKVISDD